MKFYVFRTVRLSVINKPNKFVKLGHLVSFITKKSYKLPPLV